MTIGPDPMTITLRRGMPGGYFIAALVKSLGYR